MKTLQFKCTLLSDVILNQKAASEGANKTLDFIPGSNFLGIVANELYKQLNKEEALEIFHSGKVRFGDAHPSYGNFRGLKVPAAIMEPKLEQDDYSHYVHFRIPEQDLNSDKIMNLQLKQCRSGFYDFSNKEDAKEIKLKTTFAVKSAYNRDQRRAEDEKMYGYESLREGQSLLFEVQVDNDELADIIKNALIGKKRIGRSRTAQYGLVEIKEQSYEEVKSQAIKDNITIVYADSRLIFLDKYGLPTFRPTPKDLLGEEVKGAEICWEKSQIRTFQYAPYNYKRQCFDADRCCVEKGSVIVIIGVPQSLKLQSQYVGYFKNEGFGKVIYNPDFLQAENDGKSICKLQKVKENDNTEGQEIDPHGSALLNYIVGRKEAEGSSSNTYKVVNDFIHGTNNRDGYKKHFKVNDRFASQWGTIRAFAMAQKSEKPLDVQIMDYLNHGVRMEAWNGVRKNKLKEFMEANNNDKQRFREIMVNLAAEMAKICSPKKKGGQNENK